MSPRVSALCRPGLAYPSGADAYSPDQAYPEYPWPGRISARPNPVYAAVREVLARAGLDRDRFGTPDWNPLGAWIAPGSRVFALCNFVYHRKPLESEAEFASKCTHGAVARAFLDYVLIAAGPRSRIEFGNAPVQSASWDRVLAETGADRVAAFYEEVGAPITPRDLRLYVAPRTFAGGVAHTERRSDDDVVEVDLGDDSLLAELEGRGARFRVSDYDPGRTEGYHGPGRHVYAINRRVLDADVLVSIPKLKTHEKVGLTCAVKGTVGAVALKDCLAHHRMGAPEEGGDEFPGARLLSGAASRLHEWVWRRDPGAPAQNLLRIVDRNLRRAAIRTGHVIGGAWYGNDTAWRMAVDIARILRFANPDGTLGDRPRRHHLTLVDGVVAGEGEGPLSPQPVQSGVLLFADDPVAADRAAAQAIGFDPDRLPIVREAMRRLRRFPLAEQPASEVVVNGAPAADLKACGGRPFRAPRGWRGQVEQR